ncbi:hypothetical protein [Burkholderia ambifaria]|uniref:hypothetical protein n=1 Tax=Burkholderia ambifaria TaxID=152480 RepID=UPI00158C0496|nr:hypothetical protein [Burkholderia ambifaria]
MFKPKSLLLAFLWFVVLAMIVWILLITRGAVGWGGTSLPDKALSTNTIEGRFPDFCAPMVRTPLATWLLTYREDDNVAPTWNAGTSALSLETLLPPAKARTSDDSSFAAYLPKETHWSTLISKLDTSGTIHPVAIVHDIACLHATPDGSTAYLLTNIDNPLKPARDDADARTSQTVVFRTEDQGSHWTWMKKGFFPEAAWQASKLQPYFYKGREAWAWSNVGKLALLPSAARASGDALQSAMQLYHSSDGGDTVQTIKPSAPLLVSRDDASSHFPANAQFDVGGDLDDAKGFVVQLGDNRAVAWISQSFYYGVPDSHYGTLFPILTQVELRREGENWIMGPVKRTEGATLDHVVHTPDGQIYAVMERAHAPDAVARFDVPSLSWQTLAPPNNPFWPFPSRTEIRNMWASDAHLLIATRSSYSVPRWVYPFGYDNAHVYGETYYASGDRGQHWTRVKDVGLPLAIDAGTESLLSASTADWSEPSAIRAHQLGK